MTLNQQMTLLSNLPMNGGRMSVGALNRREEYSEMEAQGWLVYRDTGLMPFFEITPAGHKAAADYWFSGPDRQSLCPRLPS